MLFMNIGTLNSGSFTLFYEVKLNFSNISIKIRRQFFKLNANELKLWFAQKIFCSPLIYLNNVVGNH